MKSLALIVLLSTSSAFAADSLIGKYTYSHFECASGKDAGNGLGGELMQASITGTSEFTEDLIYMDHTLSYKLEPAFGEFSLKMLRDALKETKDPMEIEILNSQIVETEKMMAGESCDMKAKLTYKVEGDLLTSTTTEFSSTCKGMEDTSTDVQKILSSGDVLKLQNTDAGANENSEVCGADDATIIVYKKVKEDAKEVVK